MLFLTITSARGFILWPSAAYLDALPGARITYNVAMAACKVPGQLTKRQCWFMMFAVVDNINSANKVFLAMVHQHRVLERA